MKSILNNKFIQISICLLFITTAEVGYSSQERDNSEAMTCLLGHAKESGNNLLMDAGRYVVLNNYNADRKVANEQEHEREKSIYRNYGATCVFSGIVTTMALFQLDQNDPMINFKTGIVGFGCITSGLISYKANQNCYNFNKLSKIQHQAKAQLRERLVSQMGEEEFAKVSKLSTSKEDVERLAELFKEEEWFEVVAEPESEEKEAY